MDPMSNTQITHELLQAIEGQLHLSLEDLKADQNNEMAQMFSYHLGWDNQGHQVMGKRIRPLLTILSCASLGGDWESALPAASAIELIHNFSLVHDDIEDNSETRRGRATIWKRWGISKAINLGDAIFVLSRLSSYQLRKRGLPPERILDILYVLDAACLELTIGQQLDLEFEELSSVDLDTYLRMIRGKTAALVSAATKCGGIIAGAKDDDVESLAEFGHHLGLAFQIRDDILGIWGESARTGKSTGDDIRSKKKTLPILYGLSHSEGFRKLWEIDEIDEATLLELRQALEATDAKSYALEKAEFHTQSALKVLTSIDGKDPFYKELTDLSHTLLNRDK
jgi:geranylgeranyl diphosphate synthase type I